MKIKKTTTILLLTLITTICCSFQLEARHHTSFNIQVGAPAVASREIVREYRPNTREIHHHHDCIYCGNHVYEQVTVYEQPPVVREVIVQRPIVRPFFSFSWLWR